MQILGNMPLRVMLTNQHHGHSQEYLTMEKDSLCNPDLGQPQFARLVAFSADYQIGPHGSGSGPASHFDKIRNISCDAQKVSIFLER